MKYVAVVPARSGSKRLPNKNVKLLAGKPLVVWSLEAFINVPAVEKVIFSTDSMDYWNVARQHITSEKLVLDYRTPDEAGDTVKIFDYLKDKRQKIFGEYEGAFILALPTAPLRKSQHVQQAIDLFEHEGRAVFSATEYGFPISFAFRVADGKNWEPVFPDSPMVTGNTRSQNQQVACHPNGAIYIRQVSDLADAALKTLYQGGLPYMMDRTASVDIDSEADFRIAEALI